MKIKNLFIVLVSAMLAACGGVENTNNANANTAGTPKAELQRLSVVGRPQKLVDQMAARGEQDTAAPTLKIIEPAADATISSSTVRVKLELSGDLKGYKPHMDMETKTGNHVHVILDNQPYEAYYNLEREFELRNVTDGPHTLRVFPSRPWHESYKNDGAFQMVKFTVKNGGGDPAKPATADGQPMSNVAANTASTPEGKEMVSSEAGAVDPKKPLLTYSRPKGEYSGPDAEAIMIDFWLSNVKLTGDGGDHRIRYTIDGTETKFIDKWAPIWISGLREGSHMFQLELIDSNSQLVENGGYNSTFNKITIKK